MTCLSIHFCQTSQSCPPPPQLRRPCLQISILKKVQEKLEVHQPAFYYTLVFKEVLSFELPIMSTGALIPTIP